MPLIFVLCFVLPAFLMGSCVQEGVTMPPDIPEGYEQLGVSQSRVNAIKDKDGKTHYIFKYDGYVVKVEKN